MNASAAVSVYIPTRNRSALLIRAVKSVLCQTYPNIEIIICVDHATDDTLHVLEQISASNKTDKIIKIIQLSDRSGACAARNAAIAKASGQFITGLDDDDFFESTRVAELIHSFDSKMYAFAFTGYQRKRLTKSGKIIETWSPPPFPEVGLSHLLHRNVIGNQVFTLRSHLIDIGGFDENLPAWQDYDLWLRLARRYGQGVGINNYSYVIDEVSAQGRISSCPEKISKAFQIFLEKHSEYRSSIQRSFLKMSQAAYNVRILNLLDVARIAWADPIYARDALHLYYRGLLVGRPSINLQR